MTNLMRRDPYAVDDMFDDLMKGFFVRPMRYAAEAPRIKMDVKEDEKAYTVHAEMPGVNKEDIHVNLEGNTVSISAEVKREAEKKEGEKVIHSERFYGKVERSFSLGQDVDETGATARFDKGVLELTLPKKATTATRHLTIQ
jgi:HSP20 family protein